MMKAARLKKEDQTIDDKTVLTLLDVAGSCVVDIAFNHLYDRAIAIHEKTSTGLTECYRQVLANYISESNTPRFFSMLLNSIHHYTRMSTIYSTISYPDCINLYASLFVPHMYVASLTADQKLNLLSMIFGNSVREFSDAITQQYISCIIDDHNDSANVEELQDCILKILLRERETSYDRFIESQKPTKKVTITKSAKRATTTSVAMTKLTTAFKKSVIDRANLKKRNSTLTKKHKALVTQFEQMKEMFLKQLTVHKEQATLVEELNAQVKKLSQADKPADPISER
jgi:hypothetical protein